MKRVRVQRGVLSGSLKLFMLYLKFKCYIYVCTALFEPGPSHPRYPAYLWRRTNKTKQHPPTFIGRASNKGKRGEKLPVSCVAPLALQSLARALSLSRSLALSLSLALALARSRSRSLSLSLALSRSLSLSLFLSRSLSLSLALSRSLCPFLSLSLSLSFSVALSLSHAACSLMPHVPVVLSLALASCLLALGNVEVIHNFGWKIERQRYGVAKVGVGAFPLRGREGGREPGGGGREGVSE